MKPTRDPLLRKVRPEKPDFVFSATFDRQGCWNVLPCSLVLKHDGNHHNDELDIGWSNKEGIEIEPCPAHHERIILHESSFDAGWDAGYKRGFNDGQREGRRLARETA